MTIYSYGIASSWDATSLTNIENIISIAPVGTPVPLGSVRRTTLDQRQQSNGTKIIQWAFKAMSFTDFSALVTVIWGDFATETANVTLDTRERNETFARFNAVAILPVSGQDYQRRDYGAVEDLVITFRDLQPLTSGNQFDYAFSLEFQA